MGKHATAATRWSAREPDGALVNQSFMRAAPTSTDLGRNRPDGRTGLTSLPLRPIERYHARRRPTFDSPSRSVDRDARGPCASSGARTARR